MKKGLWLFVIAFVLVVVAIFSSACNNRKLPGGPIDATPTATPVPPNNILELTITKNITSPATNMRVKLRYPDAVTVSEGITNDSGVVTISARAYGNFMIEIPAQAEYAEEMDYPIEIRDSLVQKSINLSQGSLSISLNAGQSPLYSASGGLFIYTIKLTAATPINYTLSAIGLTNYAGVTAEFDKTILTYNGDTAQLLVTIPPFTQGIGNPKKLSFRIKGTDSQTFEINSSYTSLSQDWYFEIRATNSGIINEDYYGSDDKGCGTFYHIMELTTPAYQIIWSGFELSFLTVKIKNQPYWLDNNGNYVNCADDYWLSDATDAAYNPTCKNFYYGTTKVAESDTVYLYDLSNGKVLNPFKILEGVYFPVSKMYNMYGGAVTLDFYINGLYPFSKTFCGESPILYSGYNCNQCSRLPQ